MSSNTPTEPRIKMIFAHELSREGGSWLATARTWLQSHIMNGDRVRWASGDELRMSVHQFEDAAAFIAAAAVNDERRRVERQRLADQAAHDRLMWGSDNGP